MLKFKSITRLLLLVLSRTYQIPIVTVCYSYCILSSLLGLPYRCVNFFISLKILKEIKSLRNFQSHSSLRETDLAAELGYLFHLLDNKKGGSAPASNFLRSFRVSPQATALRLVLNNGAGSADVARRHGNLGRLIQSWNRFILQQIHTDTETRDENEDDETRRKRQLSECSGQSASSAASSGEVQGVIRMWIFYKFKITDFDDFCL